MHVTRSYKDNPADKEYATRVGRRLAGGIAELGLTQAEFADAIGVNPACISYWVTGKRIPKTVSIANICDVLGWPADRLLCRGEWA